MPPVTPSTPPPVTVGRVMRSWDITTPNAIVACLLLMVLVEVGSRQLIVGARYSSLRKSTATSPSGSRPLTAAADAAALNPGTYRRARAQCRAFFVAHTGQAAVGVRATS